MKKSLILILFFFFTALYAQTPAINDAFKLKAQVLDPNTVLVDVDIKPGFSLYSDRIKLFASANSELGRLKLPAPTLKKDSQGKTYAIYRNHLQFSAWLLNKKSGSSQLSIHYQGCSDSGFCYPPMVSQITLKIDNDLGIQSLAMSKSTLRKPPKATQPLMTQQSKIGELFIQKNIMLLMMGFFGFGLLLSFTPCVLPMVPVLSGIIIGQGEKSSALRAFFISLAYVISMSLTYAALGIVFAVVGKNLQAALQTPVAISLFAIIFVLLALSMFGFYDLKLPDVITHKINRLSHHSRQKSIYFGSAIMGMLSTLILSPCVTAPLVGAFSYIAQSGNATLGAVSLFSMGLGMGAPLLVIGTSAGKLLPKAGAWMNSIKSFFGVMLLAIALYLAQRILAPEVVMLASALLLIAPSLFLLLSNNPPQKPILILSRGIGATLFVYGILILIGLSQGNTNPIYPLRSHDQGLEAKRSHENFQRIHSVKELNNALKNAHGRIIFLDYYASWCTSCKIMESTLFKDTEVTNRLDKLYWIKADVSDNSTDNIELEKRFNVIAPPTLIFLNAKGEELARLVGEVDKKTLLHLLNKISP